MTVSWMTGFAPFVSAEGYQPVLPSLAVPILLLLPGQPTLEEEEAYPAEVSHILTRL